MSKQPATTNARGNWTGRLGFILAASGSAVGLGNIWKFPYTVTESGGGAFLLIYLICVVIFGLSLVIAELALGRMAQKSPVAAFGKVTGTRHWSWVGGMGVLTAFVILSFYILVAGWAIAYMIFEIKGTVAITDNQQLKQVFDSLVGSTWTPLGYTAIFMFLTASVVIGGVAEGIERASKFLMPLLFLVLIILIVRAVTLPGAMEGIKFFLVPDFANVTIDTFTAAIGQAFFSLSLGMGIMVTFGSYLSREQNLPADALSVVCLDTLVAIMAGLIIIPAFFAAGLEPGEGGAGTTFMVLPAVFAQMPAGAVFGFFFFLLLCLAALTSSVSLLETVVSYLVDSRGLSRRAATLLSAITCLVLAIPSSLSFGLWSGAKLFGMNFFDLLDFATSYITLPLGGMLTALCLGWVVGPRAFDALRNDAGQVPVWGSTWLFILRYIAPVGIAWITIQGWL